ncbi:MAG: glycosyltransferase family 39 protein [Bacteroidota bacterium]
MFDGILKKTFIYGTLLYLFFIPVIKGYNEIIFAINYFSLFMFCAVAFYLSKKDELFFTAKHLGVIVFLYSVFHIFIYNVISYYYNNNFFVFSEADALLYDYEASRMSNMGLINGINYYLHRHESEDLGIVFILSNIYRFVESKFAYNFYNAIIGTVVAVHIYKICKYIMSDKNAFLCALTYSISSYVLWFHSSGLKESTLVALIVLTFYHYYNFHKNKKPYSLILGILCLVSILFFRPALMFIVVASIAIGILFSRKASAGSVILIILLMVSVVISFAFINSIADRFLLGSSEEMLASKESEGMIKGGVTFTYFINVLASTLGPLPTILPTKPLLSFYSSGLIFKIFISIVFWLGVIYSFKVSNKFLYPVIIFVLIEMVALAYILESLELRKSLTHFPFIFITAFWFIDFYNREKALPAKKKREIQKLVNVYMFVFLVLIAYWNFR